MSEDFFIGLSRKQVKALLAGKEIGKRPYKGANRYKMAYDDTARVFVRMLTKAEEKSEPESAFGW